MKHFLFFVLSLALSVCLSAQQQSSKSKSSDKIYEKGNLVVLKNASGANSANLDFSPAFYQNGMVYVSSRNKSGPVDKKIGETFFELYYADFDADGMPQQPQPFSLRINAQAHEGPVSFSRDGNWLYFTRNNMEKGIATANKKGKVVMKVYEAKRGALDWEDVRELPFNSDTFTCVHPALAADGKRLFFSSDMSGGYGGMDLYYVEKRADTWSKPVNLGAEVNSTGNEVFPYLHETNTLFLSSSGRGGQGGLDIFSIDISGNRWGKLQNLGVPFNSPKDDLGFIINEDATRGYLASDRAGGYGKDDLYLFEADLSLIQGEALSLSTMIVAFDEQTKERVAGASVRLFTRSADGFIEGGGLYDVQLLPDDQGGDLVMKLVRKNDGDLGAAAISTSANGEALCQMKPEKNYLVLVSKQGYESAELEHSTVGQTASQTLRASLKRKTCTSLAGVVAVENYQTRVPNALVRIVNETAGTEELTRSNASGEFSACLPAGQQFSIFAEKEGYSKGVAKVSTADTSPDKELPVTVSVKPLAEGILKEPIRTGSVIVLENIYYDFNQWFIRKGAAHELDALAELMKLYPSMEVELIAHTDSRGTEEYNLDLSLKHAEAAQRYLVQRGIAGGRIRAFGYGERQIRNHCAEGVECAEEEHQHNRRTEVKVTRIDEPVKVEYQEGDPTEKGGQ